MSFLLGPLKTILSWFFGLILTYGLEALASYVEEQRRKKAQKKINEKNLKLYEEAVKQQLPDDERRKRARDLLNGVDHS